MVKAILDGHKSMTRRVVKFDDCKPFDKARDWPYVKKLDDGTWMWSDSPEFSYPKDYMKDGVKCTYGQVGDRLWVRETFCYKVDPITTVVSENEFWYKATNPEVIKIDDDGSHAFRKDGWSASPWLPSIHMPRRASRITLEITNIRVERLQDIDEEDSIKEGILPFSPNGIAVSSTIPRKQFCTLWDSINAKRGYSWESNPWVWIIEFKKI
jgi:hypothetical protein